MLEAGIMQAWRHADGVPNVCWAIEARLSSEVTR